MYINMIKLYELCLFSHSNLSLLFRLVILFSVFIVFLSSSFDFVENIFSMTLNSFNYKDNGDDNIEHRHHLPERIDISEILPNCGIPYQCKDDEFPVHIYTGQDKDDQPKLCVGGKYVHGVGRGLNIAVIGSPHSTLKSLRNFDLYSQNSTGLEAWLEHDLNFNDIIVAFTFDEASKELSKNAKAILYLLGSGKIQDLQFRCQWYMISQKGIKGFTPLEDITYGKNSRWGKAIDKRICVPKTIEPLMVSPDPYPRRNPLREQLCNLSTELQNDDFCDSLTKHEPFIPSQLVNRSLLGNIAFSTPILVVAGQSLSSLALTLETLVYQPGVQPSLVILIHTSKQLYVPVLARIFNFKTLIINSSFPLTTNDKIEFGLSYISMNFPMKEFAIVLEEELILAWDFLFYFAQLIPTVYKDESIIGISAWNPYGYKGVSGNSYEAYRVEDFPGLGFLLKMNVFRDKIQGKMHQCCTKKSFQGWRSVLNSKNDSLNIIIPDVSRVLRRPKDYYLKKRIDNEFKIFTSPRVTNTELNVFIENPQELIYEEYIIKMYKLINSSIILTLNKEELTTCNNTGITSVTRIIRELQYKTLSIVYEETDSSKTPILKAHLRCFNIDIPADEKVSNMFKNVLRLTLNTNSLFLVEMSSPFAKIV